MLLRFLPACLSFEITDDSNGNFTYRLCVFGRVFCDLTIYDTPPTG